MIDIFSDAGLCNRLRAIDSALILAKKLNTSVKAFWPANTACGADFSELFLPVDGLTVIPGSAGNLETSWKREVYSVKRRLQRWSGNAFLLVDKVQDQVFEKLEDGTIKPDAQLQIRTNHRFQYPERFEIFEPKPEIANWVKKTTAQFPDSVIGVHIRRGDHRQAILNSPTEGFKKQIRKRLELFPDSFFFLCSDCGQIKSEFIKEFGENIIRLETSLSRFQPTGVVHAVAELWSLSHCREIWGSYGSSFSVTAYHLSRKRATLKFVKGLDLITICEGRS